MKQFKVKKKFKKIKSKWKKQKKKQKWKKKATKPTLFQKKKFFVYQKKTAFLFFEKMENRKKTSLLLAVDDWVASAAVSVAQCDHMSFVNIVVF